ncbi:MAG: ROK family protein, partial [Candidatus Cloacimonetes bacterium]|nr:ROK family protein [Candidatus Cloacimonadota bacterium]
LQTIIKRGRDFLSMGLANLAMLLDPDVIVIGGGAMEAGLYDIDQIAMTIAANTAKVNHHTAIQKAKTGNLAGVIGAILLAAQE